MRVGQHREWLEGLIGDCGRVQLRRIHFEDKSQNRCGWKSTADDLWALARFWSGEDFSLYASLNRPQEKTGRRFTDTEVERYCRLLFDFDPERPKGVASSDKQVAHAQRLRDRLTAYLSGLGWPEPALAMSGNGAHAIYRVAIPVTPESVQRLRGLYRALSGVFSDDSVKLDTTTFNPSRVCRLYGTINRKTPGGRVSSVEVPHDYRPVPADALTELFERHRPVQIERRVPRTAPAGGAKYKALDVVSWFRSHGLYRFDMGGGQHSVICPWAGEEHDISCDTDTVVWETSANGFPQFYCHHNHCNGRWMADAIEKLGDAGDYCGR